MHKRIWLYREACTGAAASEGKTGAQLSGLDTKNQNGATLKERISFVAHRYLQTNPSERRIDMRTMSLLALIHTPFLFSWPFSQATIARIYELSSGGAAGFVETLLGFSRLLNNHSTMFSCEIVMHRAVIQKSGWSKWETREKREEMERKEERRKERKKEGKRERK